MCSHADTICFFEILNFSLIAYYFKKRARKKKKKKNFIARDSFDFPFGFVKAIEHELTQIKANRILYLLCYISDNSLYLVIPYISVGYVEVQLY